MIARSREQVPVGAWREECRYKLHTSRTWRRASGVSERGGRLSVTTPPSAASEGSLLSVPAPEAALVPGGATNQSLRAQKREISQPECCLECEGARLAGDAGAVVKSTRSTVVPDRSECASEATEPWWDKQALKA